MFKPIAFILSGFIFLPQGLAGEDPSRKSPNIDRSSSEINFIASWDPTKNRKNGKTKATEKTMIALQKFKEIPELKPFFKKANGYAVFPNVAKAGMGIGGAVGEGEVFQNGRAIGSTKLTQLSIGFQLGGQAFSQIIFFKNRKDVNRFVEGNFEFGAQASAVLINQGASIETAYSNGVAVFTIAKGGLMYEASIGGQKFSFDSYD